MKTLISRLLFVIALGSASQAAAQLRVVGIAPEPHSLTASPEAEIRVRFDRPVLRDSLAARRSFWAFGRWSGAVDGEFRLSEGDTVVELFPSDRSRLARW